MFRYFSQAILFGEKNYRIFWVTRLSACTRITIFIENLSFLERNFLNNTLDPGYILGMFLGCSKDTRTSFEHPQDILWNSVLLVVAQRSSVLAWRRRDWNLLESSHASERFARRSIDFPSGKI